MTTMTANQSQYHLDLAGQVYEILSFATQDYWLNRDYRVLLTLRAQRAMTTLSALIDQPACLVMQTAIGVSRLHGLVLEIQAADQTPDGNGFDYHLVLGSWLSRLAYRQQCRVFVNQSVKSVLDQVLTAAGVLSTSWDWQVSNAKLGQGTWVQYNETDRDFLARLLASVGLSYGFVQGETARLLITDRLEKLSQALAVLTLPVVLETGQVATRPVIFKSVRERQVVCGQSLVKDHHVDRPNLPWISECASSASASVGKQFDYLPENCAADELATRAALTQAATDLFKDQLLVEADLVGVTPGQRLTISRSPRMNDIGDYYVLGVQSSGQQRAGQVFSHEALHAMQQRTSRTQLWLIPVSSRYAPARRPRKLLAGYVPAVIDNPNAESVHLDQQGRYRVKLRADTNRQPPGVASPPLPLLQPGHDVAAGWHLPLPTETPVQLASVGGGPERLVIAHAEPSPIHKNPVTQANPQDNRLQTAAGQTWLLVDGENQSEHTLHTKDQAQILRLAHTDQQQTIAMLANKGSIWAVAQGEHTLQAGGDMAVATEGNHQQQIADQYELSSGVGDLLERAQGDLSLQAEHALHMQASQGGLQLTSGKDLTIQSKKAQHLISQRGDIRLLTGGKLLAQGAGLRVAGGDGSVRIAQNGAEILLTSAGDLNISAKQIDIHAPTIRATGAKAQLGGSGQAAKAPAKTYQSEKTDPTEGRLFPSAEVKIAGLKMELTGIYGRYLVSCHSELTAKLKVGSKTSVNPVIFDEAGFKIAAKNEVAKIFSRFHMNGQQVVDHMAPSIKINSPFGEYEVALSVLAVNENTTTYTGSIEKEVSITDNDWKVAGDVELSMVVTVTKQNWVKTELHSLAYDLEHFPEQVRAAVIAVIEGQALEADKAMWPAYILIGIVVLLLTPVGA